MRREPEESVMEETLETIVSILTLMGNRKQDDLEVYFGGGVTNVVPTDEA